MTDSKYECSPEVKLKVSLFTQTDAAFKAAWEKFEQAHATELEQLEKMRDDRNAKLDEARRALRDEAMAAPITKVKTIKIGPFMAQKKWHGFYIPEKFVAKLEEKNLYDTAISEKVVAEKIEIEKVEIVQAFLDKHGVRKDFENCEDGNEMTPAIMGPKPISSFGSEVKEAK